MFRSRSPVFCAVLLTALAARAWAAPTVIPDLFPGSNVHMEVVNLPSAPPGKMAASPGGGFVTTAGILFFPAAGENVHSPAIVIVDEGPGFSPLVKGQPTRFVAQRLAAMGYTVLSLYTHLIRGFALFPFEATAPEIDSGITFLEQRGHENIVLAGSGYGAIAEANYLKTSPDEPLDTPDAKRVKAAIFFSPLTELRAYPRAGLQSSDYEARAKQAEAYVADGSGGYPAGNTLEVGGRPHGAVAPWMGFGPYNGPPEQFVSYWSPSAAARNEALLAAVRVPALVIGAGKDPAYSETHLKAAKGSAPMSFLSFPNADAAFDGVEDRAVADAARFLASHDLAVPPRIVETIIDTAAPDGRILPSMVYAPEGGPDPKKPAYVYVHGRTGGPLQYSANWLGWRLAEKGYVVFTPAFRISEVAGFASSTMAEQAEDMGRWVDTIDKLGFHKLVAVGHSNGGIYISVYMSKTHDPRIEGVAFMAPTVNERERNIKIEGQAKIDANLADAKAAIARGEGLTHMIGYITAQTYWDLNKPDTLTTHTDRIKEYSVPTLSIIGRKDPLFQNTDFTERFMANQKPGMAKLVWLENGSHGMRESRDIVVNDIVNWTKQTFGH